MPMRKKVSTISFFLYSLGQGGAQKVAAQVMNNCIANGYRVSVIVYRKEDENVDLSNQVERWYLKEDGYPLERNPFIKLVNKLNQIVRFSRIIKSISPDIVVLFGPDPLACIGVLFARYKGVLIGCERGDLNSRSPLYRSILKQSVKRCDCAVFQFEGSIERYKGYLPKKIAVIPNPCFTKTTKTRNQDSLRNSITASGRLVTEKGFDTLIEAFSLIEGRIPNISLEVFGEGPERERLESLIKDFKLENRIRLCGFVPDPTEYIVNSRLYVLSSRSEGLPNSLIEAMVMGVPIVTTDCAPGGARFLTQNGEIGGSIVPIDDPVSLSEAILEALLNPSESEEKGSRGKILAIDFSTEKVMRNWEEVFRDALHDNN